MERFWTKVRKTKSGCWLWKGALYSNGYGVFSLDGKMTGAHRASWVLTFGSIPKGLCVCHTCDVRNCVRPSHLFLGTQKDNIHDCIRKRRFSTGKKHAKALKRRAPYYLSASYRSACREGARKGAQHHNARLTETKVRKIREIYVTGKVTQKQLAARFKVNQAVISTVINRKAWRHVH